METAVGLSISSPKQTIEIMEGLLEGLLGGVNGVQRNSHVDRGRRHRESPLRFQSKAPTQCCTSPPMSWKPTPKS